MTKSNWRNELYLGERVGGAGTLVRQGIKVGGKKGGRAVQKGQDAAVRAGQGAKEKVKQGNQKKMVGDGKYEKAGALVGGLAGGLAGGVLDGPLPVGDIVGGIAGSKVGGKIGRQFDKRAEKKKLAQKEELLYDIVHDYIIAENFAYDTEGANKVILKLSDELMQEIYERTMTASEKRKDTMLKKKYDDSDMKKNMQAQYGKEEGKKVYFATIRKQAMKKEEVEQVDEKMSNYDRNRKAAAKRAAARNAARDAGKTGYVPGVGYVSPRRERETYRNEAGVEMHHKGYKAEQVKTITPKPTPTKPLSNGQGTFDKDMNYIPPGFENAKTIDKILPIKNNKDKKTEVVGEAKYEKGASDLW